jgi:predicted RNA binding protein YcfA (HicA-like mRNA interferase family)
LGWVQTGPSGSHNNYSHSNSSSIISVPRHAKDLNRITAMKILKQANNLDKNVAVTESVSRLTSNILEIAKAKIKSSKPSEDITFFSTGQDKKSKTKITPHNDCNTQT